MTRLSAAGEVPAAGADADPSVWKGPELARPGQWRLRLSEARIAEIDSALRETRRRDLTLLRLTAADFPLPSLAAGLARLSETLEGGRGFAVVRGIPVERLGETAASTVFWGIGRHLGQPVPQNADGLVLGHLRGTGRDPGAPSAPGHRTRGAAPFETAPSAPGHRSRGAAPFETAPSAPGHRTREAEPLHTDPTDLLALLALRTPRTGTRVRLAGSAAVLGAVRERRPDLADRLHRTYHFDRRGEHAPGERPWTTAPLFSRHDGPGGAPSTRYDRCRIESAQRFPEVPRLEPADRELFDLVDSVAASPEYRLDLGLTAGDLLLVNTHRVMHARPAFEDDGPPDPSSHLLRLWLALPRGPGGQDAHPWVTLRDVIRPRSTAAPGATNPRRYPA
ncbi:MULTISPECIES: TauD/TfdA family dioxygenase [unclassified Streptomyces]|uniref:TauD/TfdA family dioxygenase n=1 Tax=unclassified Streptomyces TaxID=2593676 RepID=UPI0034192E61